MKTEKASNTWDDLVFENRNKEYGAYSVRKSYSQHMTTGLGLSVALTCLLLILPRILNLISDGKSIIPPIEDVILEGTVFTQPPSFPLPEPPPPPPARAIAPPPTNLPLQVVTTEPTEIIPTNAEITAALTEPSDGVGNVLSEASTGAVDAIPAPDLDIIYVGGVSVMPAYDGGYRGMMQYVSGKVRYPASARRLGIEGTVFVAFVINREGKVTDVKVIKGISEDCDKEAVRVISAMKDWFPGRQNDRTVSVRMTLPIKFKLEQ